MSRPSSTATSCTSPARWPTTRRRISTGQTRQILAAIDGLLAEAGTDKTRILSTAVYLADIGTLARM